MTLKSELVSTFDGTRSLTIDFSQVPVLHEVRDITLARKGNVALVSYENKVCTIR